MISAVAAHGDASGQASSQVRIHAYRYFFTCCHECTAYRLVLDTARERKISYRYREKSFSFLLLVTTTLFPIPIVVPSSNEYMIQTIIPPVVYTHSLLDILK